MAASLRLIVALEDNVTGWSGHGLERFVEYLTGEKQKTSGCLRERDGSNSDGLRAYFYGIFLFGSRRQQHFWKGAVRTIQEIDVGENHRREKD